MEDRSPDSIKDYPEQRLVYDNGAYHHIGQHAAPGGGINHAMRNFDNPGNNDPVSLVMHRNKYSAQEGPVDKLGHAMLPRAVGGEPGGQNHYRYRAQSEPCLRELNNMDQGQEHRYKGNQYCTSAASFRMGCSCPEGCAEPCDQDDSLYDEDDEEEVFFPPPPSDNDAPMSHPVDLSTKRVIGLELPDDDGDSEGEALDLRREMEVENLSAAAIDLRIHSPKKNGETVHEPLDYTLSIPLKEKQGNNIIPEVCRIHNIGNAACTCNINKRNNQFIEYEKHGCAPFRKSNAQHVTTTTCIPTPVGQHLVKIERPSFVIDEEQVVKMQQGVTHNSMYPPSSVPENVVQHSQSLTHHGIAYTQPQILRPKLFDLVPSGQPLPRNGQVPKLRSHHPLSRGKALLVANECERVFDASACDAYWAQLRIPPVLAHSSQEIYQVNSLMMAFERYLDICIRPWGTKQMVS